MAKKKGREEFAKNEEQRNRSASRQERLHPDTTKSIWGIAFVGLGIIFALAGLGKAGLAGAWIYEILHTLLGVGYFIFPVTLFFAGAVFFVATRDRFVGITLVGALFVMLSVLGLIDIAAVGKGGWLGRALGSLQSPFGVIAAAVINGVVLIIAILVTANMPLRIPTRTPRKETSPEGMMPVISNGEELIEAKSEEKNLEKKEGGSDNVVIAESRQKEKTEVPAFAPRTKGSAAGYHYVAPPLSLLQSSVEKPTTGDLRANANIIKRTLESFGIPVEMGEINIGPKVTRYTLKPAEGVKLSRIVALNQDLALALAAHPIRIEAPIPGKSLVGIEVPNRAAALVRLGSLMGYKDFATSGPLGFILGRDVTGEPIFANIEKMPHLLVAGATGSGKSVVIHSLLVSLLYKNSPETLRLVLIDPKRVELSIYEGIPHLVSPVITENKKAIGVFRWAISEMERRYEVLLKAGNRDVKSYNASHEKDPLPYLLIVVDELADLMASYGREVEGSIVRLAQMARATGLHLILSTQRPSVEVITGLIKANITSRIALQVASQIDSRTILDAAGAEKLLGGGDLLFVSAELSQPRRIQGAYITEHEIVKVAGFVRENNESLLVGEEVSLAQHGGNGNGGAALRGGGPGNMFDEFMGDGDDDLYEEAVQVVAQAKKASASLLQRRLAVGYARAARLLDLMEERGIIGPGEGAKPREVYLEKIENGEMYIGDREQ